MSPIELSFLDWVNAVLSGPIPPHTVAFNFNLYEVTDGAHMQLVGCSEFSEESNEWPFAETFSSGENVFELTSPSVDRSWQVSLAAAQRMIADYLKTGEKTSLLSSSKGVGVGFVDGDVHIVHAVDAQ
jgi:hypothetical protein